MRTLVPPWPILLALFAIITARVINSSLAFGLSDPWPKYVMQGAMMAALGGIWAWPPRTDRTPSFAPTAAKLLTFFFVIYITFIPICQRAYSGKENFWVGYLNLPLLNFLLIYPLAALFTKLRATPQLPSSLALAHAALFFFWALMVPAIVQSVRPESPAYLRWIQLLAPVCTAAMLAVHLSNKAASNRPWPRELGHLCLENWRLPVLFFLGELGVIFVGVFRGIE